MFEFNAKYKYIPTKRVDASPRVIISIKLKTENFEYALKCASRPQYHMSPKITVIYLLLADKCPWGPTGRY